MVTPSEHVNRILAESAGRIANADRQAAEADVAFADGKFAEYWTKRAEEAEERVREYYRKLSGQDSAGGDSEADE